MKTKKIKNIRKKSWAARTTDTLLRPLHPNDVELYKRTELTLRRIERRGWMRGFNEAFTKGMDRQKYLTECAQQSIAAEDRGRRRTAFEQWYQRRFPNGFAVDSNYLFEAFLAGVRINER